MNHIFLNKDIYFQIDDYIKAKTKKVSADMPGIYRKMKDHLLAYEAFWQKPVTFESLDINSYESVVGFLTYDLARRKKRMVRLKTNTVGKTIKQFKTFVKDRIKKKIIVVFDMDDWIVLEVKMDAVYLSFKEIKMINNVCLDKHPHLADCKSDLVLGCLNLLSCDFSKIKQDDLRDGMLFK